MSLTLNAYSVSKCFICSIIFLRSDYSSFPLPPPESTVLLWVELCPLQIPMLKPQPQVLHSVTLFGNGAFKNVTKLG